MYFFVYFYANVNGNSYFSKNNVYASQLRVQNLFLLFSIPLFFLFLK